MNILSLNKDIRDQLANLLREKKFIISIIDEETGDTSTLVSQELSAMEKVWLLKCINDAVDISLHD